MAKLIYIMNTSVDGYVAERDGTFDWSVPTAELYATYNELQRPVGTYLYGRRLYETMSVWDTAHLEPGGTAFSQASSSSNVSSPSCGAVRTRSCSRPP